MSRSLLLPDLTPKPATEPAHSMPILRSGYATHTRNGSTRAYRKARAAALAGATHCAICGLPATPDNPLEADHIVAYADTVDNTPTNLRAVHKTCNRRRGRA